MIFNVYLETADMSFQGTLFEDEEPVDLIKHIELTLFDPGRSTLPEHVNAVVYDDILSTLSVHTRLVIERVE